MWIQNFRSDAGSQNASEYEPGPAKRNATASNNCVSAYSAPPLPISNPLGRCTRKIAPSITTAIQAAPSRNALSQMSLFSDAHVTVSVANVTVLGFTETGVTV